MQTLYIGLATHLLHLVCMVLDPDYFQILTWDVLDEWAGAKTLSRGRRYQMEGRVRDLAYLPDGSLIAWVVGSEKYATIVSSDGESLESWCTCPVGNSCKHAVAVILEYLGSVKRNVSIPAAPEGDRRLRLLEMGEMEGSDPVPEQPLRPYLERLTKEELVDLLETLAWNDPHVNRVISDRRSVAAGDSGPLLEALLLEIDTIAGESAWDECWRHAVPDFSEVQERMETLLSMGYADEVLLAGETLLLKGTGLVEVVDDEGETADQIASCMDVVFSALTLSSRPAHEKILYAVDADLKDEYDLCEGARKFLAGDFSDNDWSIVADRLLKQLKESGKARNGDTYMDRYKRERLANTIAAALDRAGRHDEATILVMREAGRTDDYPGLVARLLAEGRGNEALKWISKGISETEIRYPGIAQKLWDMLREMREGEGDWPAVASIRAEEFFYDPTYPAFRRMEEASRQAGMWNRVRDAAMQYLISGERPELEDLGLPDPGIRARAEKSEIRAPVADTLIEIAIAEERLDDVLYWHDRWVEEGIERFMSRNLEDLVADAVADAFPERSISIWKKKAERLIAEVRPQSYEASAHYLKKMRTHMEDPAWKEYIGELRQKHARKKRFLDVLDRLDGRRIIEDAGM